MSLDERKEAERYEGSVSVSALKEAGWRLEPNPEGRRVRAVHVLSLPVFLKERGFSLLTALNALHSTTSHSQILRESRLTAGEPFSHASALETERNLRATRLFSSALVFATRPAQEPPEAPDDSIEVVIVTRDIWSLRLESAFEYAGGVLSALQLNLSERNLRGERQSLSALTHLTPFTLTTSLSVADQRFGPDLSASALAGVIWGRQSGQKEGVIVSAQLGRPLYNLDQRWSMSVGVEYLNRLYRLTQGATQVTDTPPTPMSPGEAPRPVEWDLRSYAAALSLTRQWSGALQRYVTLSLDVSDARRALPEGLSEETRARWRRAYLPPDRQQLGPSLSASISSRRYVALHDVSSFGLSEDLRLGLSAGAAVALSAVGDTALSPSASSRWAEVWGGEGGHAGFVALEVSGGARLQPSAGRGARLEREGGEPRGAEWVNAALSAAFSAASPKLLGARGGRLVTSALWAGRWWDTQRLMVSLGGDSGLRGYPTQAFYALSANLARLNVEYRSDPLVLSFLHFGGALFYDGGAVYRGARDLVWRQSVGVGARALAPQLNRSVFRVDVGVPLRPSGEAGGWQALLSVSSSQGFALMPWEALQ